MVDANVIEQGVYRISGNSSTIQKLVAKANADIASLDLAAVHDIHAITGLLKLYFRELREPIFTEELYDRFIAAASTHNAGPPVC